MKLENRNNRQRIEITDRRIEVRIEVREASVEIIEEREIRTEIIVVGVVEVIRVMGAREVKKKIQKLSVNYF